MKTIDIDGSLISAKRNTSKICSVEIVRFEDPLSFVAYLHLEDDTVWAGPSIFPTRALLRDKTGVQQAYKAAINEAFFTYTS